MMDKPKAAVLAEAAAAAGYAPSVHNTQPWHWHVSGDRLDLFADRSRQLHAADPLGRLLTLSCGAAVHHVKVALAADGWDADVELSSDGADNLARIVLGDQIAVTAQAMRDFQAMRMRHTDRRPVSDVQVPSAAIEAIRLATVGEGAHLHLLTADQVLELGSASAQADRLSVADPRQREELAYWIGGQRGEGTGVPDTALLAEPAQTLVPGRDFVHHGTLPPGEGSDRAARFAVLFSDSDDEKAWLQAGMAMSAGWLAATELGVSVLPFSAVVEVAATRETLRRLLSGIGYPQLVLRLGAPDPLHAGAPHTPRLPSDQVIDIAG